MSCFESLTKSIDREVTSLLKNISSKYNIDEKEILEMWTNKITISSSPAVTTPEENALLKLSKKKLKWLRNWKLFLHAKCIMQLFFGL